MMKKCLSFLLALLLLSGCCGLFAVAAAGEPLPYPDSRFFSIGDYTLHYRVKEAVAPKGQILFLHGFFASTYCWEKLTRILSESGYTCVLVDLPDFGFSSRETASTKKVKHETVVHALMQSLSDQPWYLAGHSMGGFAALALAQTYPDSVKNLLLYSSCGNNGWFRLLDPLTTNNTVASIAGSVIETLGQSRFLVKMLMHYATQDRVYLRGYDFEKLRAPFCVAGTGAGIVRYLSMQTDTDYDAVRKMPPMLYINGDRDCVCPPTERIALRRAMPQGSTDVVLPGAGHMLIESRAAEVAALTLGFLAAHP